MGGLWMGGLSAGQGMPRSEPSTGRQQTHALELRIQDLEHHIGRLSLMNQALWELLRERAGMTDADLEHKAHEVDLRDGVEDGAMTQTPVKCPTCGRVSNSKHWRCLYCGQMFQKPVMG